MDEKWSGMKPITSLVALLFVWAKAFNRVSVHADVGGGVREDDGPAASNEPPAQLQHVSGQQLSAASQIPRLPQEEHGDVSEEPGESDHVARWWFTMVSVRFSETEDVWFCGVFEVSATLEGCFQAKMLKESLQNKTNDISWVFKFVSQYLNMIESSFTWRESCQ